MLIKNGLVVPYQVLKTLAPTSAINNFPLGEILIYLKEIVALVPFDLILI